MIFNQNVGKAMVPCVAYISIMLSTTIDVYTIAVMEEMSVALHERVPAVCTSSHRPNSRFTQWAHPIMGKVACFTNRANN